MKFEELVSTDYEWSDWHAGSKYSPERQKRYSQILEMIAEVSLEALELYNKGLTMIAQVPPDIFATGTKGDHRIYCPIVWIFANKFPRRSQLENISTYITNRAPVSHVIHCVSKQLPTDLKEAVEMLGGGPGIIEERRAN